MDPIEKILKDASTAMHEGRFDKADLVLSGALLNCKDEEEVDLLLQGLMHLYSHVDNRDVNKAQEYMDMRESRQPLAHIALSQAYFHLYTRSDSGAALVWAQRAIERAQAENDWFTLYSASAVCGLVASGREDGQHVVLLALDLMDSAIGKDEYISYGDAVNFLEAEVRSGGEAGAKARQLAARIAPLIEDKDFRARAEMLIA